MVIQHLKIYEIFYIDFYVSYLWNIVKFHPKLFCIYKGLCDTTDNAPNGEHLFIYFSIIIIIFFSFLGG